MLAVLDDNNVKMHSKFDNILDDFYLDELILLQEIFPNQDILLCCS